MKLILVHNEYREPGGEDVVFESEKRLLERAGHQVVPYLRSNSELDNANALGRLGAVARMAWSSKSRREFSVILDKEQPDLVHVHNTFLVISPSIYSACSERRIPVVQTLHNYRLLCPSANLFRDAHVCHQCVDGSLLQSVRHACYRDSRAATASVALMLATHRVLDTWRKSISRFIVLTEFSRKLFVDAGFPADKLVVKPNFADRDPGERQNAGDFALFVGRLTQDKGLRILLNAWKALPVQIPLRILGEGAERASLEAEVRACGLSGITFLGRVSREEVILSMKAARVLIVPSIWYEGFPMSIVESFACGTPVICSRLGGMAEIVRDRHTGLHFEPGDTMDLASKVRWAWDHRAELHDMGRAARRAYEAHYTADKNLTMLMYIYQQTLASKEAGALASRSPASAQGA